MITRKIPYGIANYAELVQEHCYFVDKPRYIFGGEGEWGRDLAITLSPLRG